MESCMSWCLKNDIIIYPIIWKESKQQTPPRLAIQINYQGFKRTGDILWSQKNKKEKQKMYKRIQELYCYYYNRDN
tara:strand:+ start:1095 stop:1322 length:228 start_codon:yes stop_codon:yes gene_type:complete